MFNTNTWVPDTCLVHQVAYILFPYYRLCKLNQISLIYYTVSVNQKLPSQAAVFIL